MKREDINNKVLASTKDFMLLECATGVGKSKLSLDKLMQWYNPNSEILIVIPRNVLIKNWLDEIHKWGYDDIINNITFSTYVSVPKQDASWDIVIFDECHHLSERCQETITNWLVKHAVFLSATIKRDLKYWIMGTFTNLEIIHVKTQDAITSDVLPEPIVYLLPLTLECRFPTCTIVKNPKGKTPVIETSWMGRWAAWKQKVYKVHTYCTQEQYYEDMSNMIDWYKRRAMSGNVIFKNQWLHRCGERLKWLSDQKVNITRQILEHLGDNRVLTFCASIEQSESFGRCVNSKVGTDNLTAFNLGSINHIAAVGMLDEGCNLTNCQVGIFNMLNSSDRLSTQRIGRILRHKKPVIIVPYFRGTRDEEIVKKMLEGYSQDLIKEVHSIKEIKVSN